MSFEVKNFSEVISDKSGGNTKIPQANFQATGRYPIIDQGKDFIAGYTDDETTLLKSTTLPVVIFGDHTKIIKYVDFPFALGADGVKVLKPSAEAYPKYIYHFLKSVHILDAGYSRHFKFLKETKIPLPSLPTQTHIAHVLDKADELRQKRQTAIKKLDELLQATFIKMFGDPVKNLMGWDVLRISQFCQTGSGGTPSRQNPEFYTDGTIAWVKSGELKNRFVTQVEEYITEEAVKKSSAKLVPNNALLIAMYGATVGDISQLTFQATTNQAVCHVLPNNDICHTDYLYWVFQFLKPILLSKRMGGGQPNISQSVIKDCSIPMPPLSLQTQFAQIATQIENQKAKLQAQADELEGLFLSLQQRAFDGRLTNSIL